MACIHNNIAFGINWKRVNCIWFQKDSKDNQSFIRSLAIRAWNEGRNCQLLSNYKISFKSKFCKYNKNLMSLPIDDDGEVDWKLIVKRGTLTEHFSFYSWLLRDFQQISNNVAKNKARVYFQIQTMIIIFF